MSNIEFIKGFPYQPFDHTNDGGYLALRDPYSSEIEELTYEGAKIMVESFLDRINNYGVMVSCREDIKDQVGHSYKEIVVTVEEKNLSLEAEKYILGEVQKVLQRNLAIGDKVVINPQTQKPELVIYSGKPPAPLHATQLVSPQ
jgi:hypothetical protein